MKFPALDIEAIKKLDFPENQYFQEVTKKVQICLHHTASGRGADGDWRWWLDTPSRIATACIVDHDGVIWQCFLSKYWGHHLGTKAANNTALNRGCIGIEIDSWGPLVQYHGGFRSYTGALVKPENVQEYPNGFKTLPGGQADQNYFFKIGAHGKPCFHYEKYTEAQILSTAQLLEAWCAAYGIPTRYQESMWSLSPKALAGEPGIWTHVSYREDKQDCHPQPELITMLQTLAA